MPEAPTEDTYTTELVSMIKQIGSKIDFDAEVQWRTESGRPDIKLIYKNKTVAIIEVKTPQVPLSDQDLKNQAMKYAEWYRKEQGIIYYGVHNYKYLNIFKYVGEPKNTLDRYIPGRRTHPWVSISDFPFEIAPWAVDSHDYKIISNDSRAQGNLSDFLLRFREILLGKTLDLSNEVILNIRNFIERGALDSAGYFKEKYDTDLGIKNIVNDWFSERGMQPKNDAEIREFLRAMLKEQLYTFSMKILFYLVLQRLRVEMATKLREDLSKINLKDPEMFKGVYDSLFTFAMKATNDFEEVFGSNTVDKIPFLETTIAPLNELINYLNQIRWGEVSVDVIGRVFEGLIYEERRHLLGQHFTNTKVVDLILYPTLKDPGLFLDPSCGSGTFIVRSLNLWKTRRKLSQETFNLVEGIDIDKLASMLSKINLYIQALDVFENEEYIPKILRKDFFKTDLAKYAYVSTNPPYTNQVEMIWAFYDKDYKKQLAKTVEDIENWSNQASIYSYFLIKAGKLLAKKGRLGFIVENSWENANYGLPIKKWFLDNFSLEYIMESLVERWFEDAKIITNILIAEKTGKSQTTKFLYFKKSLNDVIGVVPPSTDLQANCVYYDKISKLLSSGTNVDDNQYSFYEDEDVKVVTVSKDLLRKVDDKYGKWGMFRGFNLYTQLLINHLEGSLKGLTQIKDIFQVNRGLTTNANELFYLPSKFWELSKETEDHLDLYNKNEGYVSISMKYLKKVLRPEVLKSATYKVSNFPIRKKEDYVLSVEDEKEVTDSKTKQYIEWIRKYITQQNKIDNRKYPTLINKSKSSKWLKLPDTSPGIFLLRNDMGKNYAIFIKDNPDLQVDKRLFFAVPKDSSIDKELAFATLNSVLTYMGMELFGRTNLGEGALDVNVTDYDQIVIVDPNYLFEHLMKLGKIDDFKNSVKELMNSKPLAIEEEVQKKARIKMDTYVLSALGLEKHTSEFYNELIKLSKQRENRAKNILN